jgi:ABC-2 type transport system ATP-binding protein
LRSEQRTILLTTHYIEEAEKLCDRVAIVDEGRIIAIGSPREIQAGSATLSVIEVRCTRPLPGGELPCWPEAERAFVGDGGCALSVSSRHPGRTIVEMMKWIDAAGVELEDIRLTRPSLEQAFLELTGKSLRE